MSSVNLSNVLMRTQQSRITWGAKSSLRLSDFASVPESIGKKSSLVLSKLPSPKARAKSASVALTRFQQTCSNKQTVQSIVKQWEVKPHKIVNALQAMLLFGLVRFVPGTSEQIHLTSVPRIVISTPRRHILRCRTIVFTDAGLLCQWSKLQPIGPLPNFTASREEASGTKCQGPHGNLPASQKAVSNRTSKAKSKHRFKKLSWPNAKHWIVSFSLHLAQRGILWWRLISPLWFGHLTLRSLVLNVLDV